MAVSLTFLISLFAALTVFPTAGAQVTVGPGGQFRKLQEALNRAAAGTRIVLLPGTYREKVRVSQKGIQLIGTPGKSIIVWGDSAGEAGGTDKSATFTVLGGASGFTATGVSFVNDHGPNKKGSSNQQAVALYVLADSSFYNCRIDGHQDTLFAHAGRQYYKSCWISGTVDFAFGAGTVFFEDCTLYAKKRVDSTYATYTAQQRNTANAPSGFVFLRGSIQCGLGVKGWLGRAWGTYARTIFIQTFMHDCIRPEGWTTMKSFKATSTTFFAEYQCTGPGSNRQGRVPWAKTLTPAQARFFSSKSNFIGRS
ncbi:hypothetical protein CBR_g32306 [Chara braunii]|uniref:pectinesterase n=1 Tax=Chara braunii TaxID=69332 RepID=A0A388JNG6_CHABU|nr:hypothetical protein CBR_g32306 [Chara braunii]|eukprot:GBG59293.1 hypothetical protein CBR_g32306 [Chara braunii]